MQVLSLPIVDGLFILEDPPNSLGHIIKGRTTLSDPKFKILKCIGLNFFQLLVRPQWGQHGMSSNSTQHEMVTIL